MSDIILRSATRGDLSRLSQLWYEHAALLAEQDPRYILLPNARAAWERAAQTWLEERDVQFLVACQPAEPVGCIVAAQQAGPPGFAPEVLGVIRLLVVDAHRHSAGAARLLLSGVQQWFVANGIRQIVVDVPKRAVIEQAFWRAQNGTPWMERLWIVS